MSALVSCVVVFALGGVRQIVFYLSSLLIIGSGVAIRVGLAEVTAWDKSTPDVLRRAVIVPEADFHVPNLVAISRRILSENRDRKVVQFLVATDEKQVNQIEISDLTFKAWLRFHQRLADVNWRVSELIAFDEKAVLRIRDGPSITRVLLEGDTDPLFMTIDGIQFEILHIAFPQVSWANSFHEVHVYARCTKTPPKETIGRLFISLRERLHPKCRILTVQNNNWFIFDETFPIYYWFDNVSPPTEAQYRQTWSVKCFENGSGVKCY